MAAPQLAGAPEAKPGTRQRLGNAGRPSQRAQGRYQQKYANRIQPQEIHPETRDTQTERSKALLGRGRLMRALGPQTKTAERISAIAASVHIAWIVVPFYAMQFVLWLIGLTGIGLEIVPIANIFLPGSEVFLVSYIVIAFIGICSMLYAALAYTLRGVRCFAGTRTLMFAFCLTLYLVFFLNLFPWVILWMFSIIYTSGEGLEEEKE